MDTVDFGRGWDHLTQRTGRLNRGDVVNHPSHYTSGKVECLDAIESAVNGKKPYSGYLVGNIIKYLWRFDKKNGVEDLKKAQFYLARLIEEEENVRSET